MRDVCVCLCGKGRRGYTDREMTLNGIGAQFKAGRAYMLYVFLGRNSLNESGPEIIPPKVIFFEDRKPIRSYDGNNLKWQFRLPIR